MSREIKFRAWAFDDDFMVDETYNDDDFVFVVECGKVELLEAKFDQINQCVKGYGKCKHSIMQYTGLKDKNGVEIYEGDILHSLSSDNLKPMLVNFNDCCFSVSYWGDRNCSLGKLVVEIEDLAVIGNAYENPELLESKR